VSKTAPFNAADYLTTPTAIAEFIIGGVKSRASPAEMADTLRVAAKARRALANQPRPADY
jgi:hypothetical protein